MSEDPETARQIAELALGDRPLAVVDVDEVVLEFVRPFQNWLATMDLELRTDSFRLNGNVRFRKTGVVVENERVSSLIDEFFGVQDDWQFPLDSAAATLERLAGEADIVLLTAMPHRYHGVRRNLLQRHGIPFPLLTTDTAKGPAVAALRGGTRPVAFVDDIAYNHVSVAQHVSDAACIHLMAHQGLRSVMPPLPEGVAEARDWPHAADLIRRHFGR